MPFEDLKQEALMGLLVAYDKFDPTRGTQFSTYATYWIKKHILQALNKEYISSPNFENYSEPTPQICCPESASESLELPPNMPELEAKIVRLSYETKLTIKEIAQALNLSNEQTKQLRSKALRRIKADRSVKG
jgi:RNA polymerase sigma factor (sigma-70 family)